MTRAFFDSNILLYGYVSNDARQTVAQQLIDKGGAISAQCLNEFASVARRKFEMDWDHIEDALSVIAGLCTPVIAIDLDLHRLGINKAKRYRLSVYDGMIVAAALTAGCDTLYSEDMHHGLVIDGRLTIENPFRTV